MDFPSVYGVLSSNRKPVRITFDGTKYELSGEHIKQTTFIYNKDELRKKLNKGITLDDSKEKLDIWADEALFILEQEKKKQEALYSQFTELFQKVVKEKVDKISDLPDYDLGRRKTAYVVEKVVGAFESVIKMEEGQKKTFQTALTRFFDALAKENKEVMKEIKL